MSNLLQFIRSRQFLLHLGLILLTIVISFFIVIKWLSSYTDHGEFIEVPDFKEQEIGKLDAYVEGKSVSYQIIDSIYDPKQKPGIVIRQDPDAGSKVKHNRKVYLYVTGMVPPQVSMPKLVDRSERQARLIISSYGLKVGRITEKQADCNGCVLAQLSNGKNVEAGDAVKKGSVIDLVIGVKGNYQSMAGDTTKTEQVNFNNEPE